MISHLFRFNFLRCRPILVGPFFAMTENQRHTERCWTNSFPLRNNSIWAYFNQMNKTTFALNVFLFVYDFIFLLNKGWWKKKNNSIDRLLYLCWIWSSRSPLFRWYLAGSVSLVCLVIVKNYSVWHIIHHFLYPHQLFYVRLHCNATCHPRWIWCENVFFFCRKNWTFYLMAWHQIVSNSFYFVEKEKNTINQAEEQIQPKAIATICMVV